MLSTIKPANASTSFGSKMSSKLKALGLERPQSTEATDAGTSDGAIDGTNDGTNDGTIDGADTGSDATRACNKWNKTNRCLFRLL